jgi:secondary thiamine-phosphate synthase enzyme
MIRFYVEREINRFTIKFYNGHSFFPHWRWCIIFNLVHAVRKDFEMFFNKTVPENDSRYQHDYEGADDMPAHLKASLLGSSVTIPITDGALALGMWQSIYLCEHRNHGDARTIAITVWGE